MPQTLLSTFEDWLASGKPGSQFVYHVGHLAADRVNIAHGLDGSVVFYAKEPYETIGETAWQAHLDGKVRLVQRRKAKSVSQYIAVMRQPTEEKQRETIQ